MYLIFNIPLSVASGERTNRAGAEADNQCAVRQPCLHGREDLPATDLCAESQLREDCGGETCPAPSPAAEAANPGHCDPVGADVAHNSARPSSVASASLPILQIPYSDQWRLVVRKECGLFVLREFLNGALVGTVTAAKAQAIHEHINANWPVGTVAQWIVVPPITAPVSNCHVPFIHASPDLS